MRMSDIEPADLFREANSVADLITLLPEVHSSRRNAKSWMPSTQLKLQNDV